MKCKNCGAELADGMMFCLECGEKNETPQELKFCPQCGTKNAQDAEFCGNCGFSFRDGTVKQTEKKAKTKGKKGIVVGAVVCAAAVAAGAFFFLKPSGAESSSMDHIVYLKDNEIHVMSGKKPVALGEPFYQNQDSAGLYADGRIAFSKDGSYIYFPSDYVSGSYDLYRKKIKSKKDDAQKIASEISGYQLLTDGRVVVRQSDGEKLSVVNTKGDKEKLDSDVDWYSVSDDSKQILWGTSDDKMYVRDLNLKKEEKKLDSDVDTIIYISEDLKTILYKREENLCIMENFGEREKIASDVEQWQVSARDGKVVLYYTKDSGDGTMMSLADIIDDDMAAADAQMQEPRIEDYQTTVTKPSFWGTQESVETDDAYYEAYSEYEKKLQRDSIRSEFNEDYEMGSLKLYCYDCHTKKSEEIFTAPVEDKNIYCSDDGTVVLQYVDLENAEKIPFSRLTEMDYSEMEKRLMDVYDSCVKTCVIKGKAKQDLDIDTDAYNILEDARIEGSMVYLLFLHEEDASDGALLSTNLAKDNGKMTEISDEVSTIELTNSEGVYYIASMGDNYEGELYLNDTQISDEVYSGSVRMFGDKGISCYIDMSGQEGTLMIYQNKKGTKVGEDVADYVRIGDSVLYLSDYNFKKYRGDLNLYKNGKSRKLDDDVTAIIKY